MLRNNSAPLNQVTQYEKVNFNEGLHGKRTRYMGFTQEADDAWNELQQGESLFPILFWKSWRIETHE